MRNLLTSFLLLLVSFSYATPGDFISDTLQAREYMNKGFSYSLNYQKDSTLYYFQKAADLYEKHDQWKYHFYCKNGISRMHMMFGEYERSLEISNEVIVWSEQKLGANNIQKAKAIINKAIVDHERRFYKRALKLNHSALEIMQNTVASDDDLANVYNLMGIIYKDMGSYDLSIEYIKKTLEISKEVDGPESHNAAYDYDNLGRAYQLKGEYLEALANHQKALKIRLKLFDEKHVQVGVVYNHIAIVYKDIEELDSAIYFYKKALNIFVESLGQDHEYSMIVKGNIGKVYFLKGDFNTALELLQHSIDHQHHKANNNASLTINYKDLADCYLAMDSLGKALEYYDKSIHANILEPSDSIMSNDSWVEQAQDPINLANALAGKAETLWKKYESYVNLQFLEESQLTYFQADQVVSAIRKSNLNSSDKYLITADYSSLYTHAVDVSIRFFQRTRDQQHLNEAFRLIEKNKSRILLESIGELSAKRLAIIPEHIADLEGEIKKERSNVKTQLIKERAKFEKDSVLLSTYENRFFNLNRTFDSIQLVLEKNYPKYYQLKYDESEVEIQEVQKNLDDETAILEYFDGDSTFQLFVITSRSVSHSILIDKSSINKEIKRFGDINNRWSISDQSDSTYVDFVKCANNLRTLVFQDSIQLQLKEKGIQNLVIVPDGKLSYIPFEILLVNNTFKQIGNYSSLSYLLKDFSISYAFSSTINFDENYNLKSHLTENNYLGYAPSYAKLGLDSSNLLALGKFRNSITNLEWNKDEVLTTSSLIGGNYRLENEATESNFKEDASNYGIIHLAMHALIDDEDPMMSKLVFAKDENDSINDGLLHTYEIFNMNMNPELVVLSACNTGYGKLERGEGVNSLAYAFAYAGCPSIVMSQWQVDDKSTSILMKDFFKNLSGGMSKSKALREAKLNFLNDPSSRYANPSYWAGFVLIGNADSLNQYNGYDIFIIWIGVGMAILVVGFLIIRRRYLSV